MKFSDVQLARPRSSMMRDSWPIPAAMQRLQPRPFGTQARPCEYHRGFKVMGLIGFRVLRGVLLCSFCCFGGLFRCGGPGGRVSGGAVGERARP